jgi:hypothetical protein
MFVVSHTNAQLVSFFILILKIANHKHLTFHVEHIVIKNLLIKNEAPELAWI